ncbi:MAG: HDOD domain-containing protein [Verrucomicrobiota bacterium]|nr:HDOD domain-containing protein [Verrucomicrobiota bacterium]
MNRPSDFLLIERINQCPKLASLKSINQTLEALLESEDSFMAQIAEVIRLDPSLTTRVLDLVNSIFFGSKEDQRISGVEEASIFLGLNRIKELLAATPVIEEIFKLGKNSTYFPWVDFWRHSIGVAILTREILSLANEEFEQEEDYIAGLLHNLGILIIAITFPDHFQSVYGKKYNSLSSLLDKEIESVGWNHAKVGAYYLWNHHISEEVVEGVHWHNEPDKATVNPKLAAAIQVADYLTKQLNVEGMEKTGSIKPNLQFELSGWNILFGEIEKQEEIREELSFAVDRLSQTLQGII